MCNCSKQITVTECQRLRKYNSDPLKRFFIYYVDDKKGLQVAFVPKDKTPLQIAHERNFYNSENQIEFFNIREHPCLTENE
jgi:hypothetical protein